MQTVVVKRVLHAHAVQPEQYFWHYLMGATADVAAIEWCKVFGSTKEATHWTNAVPHLEHDDLRQGLYAAVSLTKQGWRDCRKSILDYRNQLAAHHDLNRDVKVFPAFDAPLLAAFYMYERLRLRSSEDDIRGLPFNLQRWADSVQANTAIAVQAGFNACRNLGRLEPELDR